MLFSLISSYGRLDGQIELLSRCLLVKGNFHCNLNTLTAKKAQNDVEQNLKQD